MRFFAVALFLFVAVVAVRSQICSEAKVLAEAKSIKLGTDLRVRRDWMDLTQTEKNTFLYALTNISKSGWLSEFQCYHLSETQLPAGDLIHGTSIFFLWHRIFLWHIEGKMLQYGIPGLPYWSFEYNSVDPKNGVVFTNDAFGQTNTQTQCAVLDKSILKGISLDQPIYQKQGCIKRNPDTSAPLYDDAYMAKVEATAATFSAMERGFGGPHASYHNYWGASSFMRGMGSPRDPVFWLFHANLDRHLTLWQLQHPSAGYTSSEKTLSRYALSPQTALNLKNLNIQYQPPNPANQAKRVNLLVDGAVKGLTTETGGFRKRSINIDSCLAEFSQNFLTTPRPASETFKRFLSPAGAPKNTFRLFLDTMDRGYDRLSDDELVKKAADNIRFDAYLDWYTHVGALYEDFDTCTDGFLQELGAKITERGVLLFTILNALKHDDDLRAALSQIPLLISRSWEATVDASSLDELNDAGNKLTIVIIGLVGATVPIVESSFDGRKRNVDDVPPQWTCDPLHYDAKDGCDCGCGIPDPDCPDQRSKDSFSGEPVPIFGCPKKPNLQCAAGVCISTGAPPASWKCHPGDFNSTNGCDCNCGAFDPDCGVHFPARYKKLAPFLYGVTGCSNGIKPTCSHEGTCSYTREVPQAWKCPNVQYGSKDGCHCGCGAYDPDCDDRKQTVSGCHCLNMTCSRGGFCEGICGGYKIFVHAAAEAPADSNASTTSSSSGLSGGAIAGIVVGSVVGAILLVAIIAFLVKGKSANYSAVMQE